MRWDTLIAGGAITTGSAVSRDLPMRVHGQQAPDVRPGFGDGCARAWAEAAAARCGRHQTASRPIHRARGGDAVHIGLASALRIWE
jgi:hypothetical protein